MTEQPTDTAKKKVQNKSALNIMLKRKMKLLNKHFWCTILGTIPSYQVIYYML